MTASTGSSARPRRVLIIVENLPVPFDRRVWAEATTLRQHGYEVSVICPKGKDATAAYEVIDGVHVYRHPLPMEARGGLGYLLEYGAATFHQYRLALKVARERGFDVIQGCNPPDTIWLVALPFTLFGKRYVFDHHDICPELFEAKFEKRGALYGLMRWLERRSFGLAHVSIATNESYRRIAIERGGMDPEDVFVVRSGPKLDRLQVRTPNSALKRGKRFLIGYVGVIGRQEGLDLLLDSLEHLVRRRGRDDVHTIVVGGGPELDAIRKEAAARRLDDVVEFTGRAPDDLLLDVLNTADVCVNPDRHNEMNDKSTMNKIMEYMALGKPIVQFDLTEGRFSAQDASLYAKANDAGDFAEKISYLLDNPDVRARMGAFGRERVVNALSWEGSIAPLLQAYDRAFHRLQTSRAVRETAAAALSE